MNASELRIGNLFYKIDRTQKVHMPIEVPMVVAEIGIPFVKFYPLGTPIEQVTKYFDVELFSMTPIPLTEEWLLQNGFTEKNYDYTIPISDCGLVKLTLIPHDEFPVDCSVCVTQSNEDGGEIETVFLSDIKHIHQLQNLYFSFCGKELIIKNN